MKNVSMKFILLSLVYLIVNIGAENDSLAKRAERRKRILCQSSKGSCAYVHAGAGIGESSADLLFSGDLIIAESGALLKDMPEPSFDNKLVCCDIDIERLNVQKLHMHSKIESSAHFRYIECKLQSQANNILRDYSKTPFVPEKASYDKDCETILEMQAYGLARRLAHLGNPNLIIGVSGGLDSTLALLVCARACNILGEKLEKIIAVTMPGLGTSKHTYQSSIELIDAIGATSKEISIKEAVALHFKDIGHNPQNKDITYENAQVRERTQILMDLANKLGGIVIGTSSLSELALGWTTFAGDQMAMYTVNACIAKTLVKELIAYSASQANAPLKAVLQRVLATPISPELLPTDDNDEIAQKTESVLGDYILHDFFLYHFLTYGARADKLYALAAHTFRKDYESNAIKDTLKKFINRFMGNQFKRNSMPDGANIGSVNLSPRGYFCAPSDASSTIWLQDLQE